MSVGKSGKLQGIFAAMVTPFKEDSSVNYDMELIGWYCIGITIVITCKPYRQAHQSIPSEGPCRRLSKQTGRRRRTEQQGLKRKACYVPWVMERASDCCALS